MTFFSTGLGSTSGVSTVVVDTIEVNSNITCNIKNADQLLFSAEKLDHPNAKIACKQWGGSLVAFNTEHDKEGFSDMFEEGDQRKYFVDDNSENVVNLFKETEDTIEMDGFMVEMPLDGPFDKKCVVIGRSQSQE